MEPNQANNESDSPVLGFFLENGCSLLNEVRLMVESRNEMVFNIFEQNNQDN